MVISVARRVIVIREILMAIVRLCVDAQVPSGDWLMLLSVWCLNGDDQLGGLPSDW